MSRVMSSSRTSSSYLDISQASKHNRSSSMDPIFHPRELDRVVWHNPSSHQMAETLKVVMMTQGSFEAIPVQYNSCILHILEAYHDMRLEMIAKDREHEEDVKKLSDAIITFETEESNWLDKEEIYKAEIRRLEIMLATGERGLDMVTSARSKSALNRDKVQSAAAGDKEIRKRQENLHTANPKQEKYPIMTVEFAAQRDARVSALLLSSRCIPDHRRDVHAAVPAAIPVHRHRDFQNLSPTIKQRTLQQDTAPKITAADLQHAEDSSPSPDSSPEVDRGPGPSLRRLYRSPNEDKNLQTSTPPSSALSNVKPLPEISQGPKLKILRNARAGLRNIEEGLLEFDYKYLSNDTSSNFETRQGGFSFVPGDDSHDSLAVPPKGGQDIRKALDTHANQRFKDDFESEAYPEAMRNAEIPSTDPQKPPAANTDGRSSSTQGKVTSRGPNRFSIPQHNGSQSSVVTAVRDNSGRSITKHPTKLNRPSGSSDATIAAVRAIASNEKIDDGKIHQRKILNHSYEGSA